MIFNGREITKELFFLDDSNLNPEGLYGYALRLAENLGINYLIVENLNDEPYDSADYWPDENDVTIAAIFFDKNRTKEEYKITKGLIDHETGHALWPDTSYFFKNNDDKNQDEKNLIYDVGNLIDDIRIERRLAKNFLVDKNNFRLMMEMKINNFNESKINNFFFDIFQMVTFATNITYRETIISFYGEGNVSKWGFFNNSIKPLIDRFLESNDNAGDTAKEIICLMENVIQNNFEVIKKIYLNGYIIRINGKIVWLIFIENPPFSFNEGDVICTEFINWVMDYIVYLQDVPPEEYTEDK